VRKTTEKRAISHGLLLNFHDQKNKKLEEEEKQLLAA